MNSDQSGNVLFLILIAVALFAALSYVVTSTTRIGGSSISDEKARMAAADVLQFATSVRAATARMLVSGVLVENLDFRAEGRKLADGSSSLGNNGRCTTTNCRVFHPEGGAIPWRHFEEYRSTATPLPTSIMPGHSAFQYNCVKNLGSDLPDLFLLIYDIDPAICKLINRVHDLPYPASSETRTFYSQPSATEAQINTLRAQSFGDTKPELSGKPALCIGASVDTVVYISLVER